MNLKILKYTKNINNNNKKSHKLKNLFHCKSRSLKMSKMSGNINVDDTVYPIITIQSSFDKKIDVNKEEILSKENIINDNNNVQSNTNSSCIKEDDSNNLSPTKTRCRHIMKLKLSNSLLNLKRKTNSIKISSKSTHSFLMTPLFRNKKNTNDSVNIHTATTYGQSIKDKCSRVGSNLSMNSTPGDSKYFSDASSAHSFISSSTGNTFFSSLCKKKTGKKLKRKDFSESIKVLGSGATGNIHLVYKKDCPDKYYALKEFIIPQHKLTQERERKFFKHLQSEYTIGTLLHHRNVIEVESFIYNDYYKRNRKERHVYQVMEYCNGGDLFDGIQSGKMTQGTILCFFRQLMDGLAYIHSMGVAHRDLKPENIMFKDNKILKILDFGAAIMFKTPYSNEIIRCSGIVGSEPYMAPEQFGLKSYDPRTVDIWSCGIIFLAMFYNELPWKSAILSNRKYKMWAEKGVNEIINDLPNGPKQLISRMLEPDPNKRITMKEIYKDKWFKHINCCLDSELEDINGNMDNRYLSPNLSYTPSLINSCLRRNVSSAASTNNTLHTSSSSKKNSIKLSNGSVTESDTSYLKDNLTSSSTNDNSNITAHFEENSFKKAIFIVDSESDEEKESEPSTSEPSTPDIKKEEEVVEEEEEEEEEENIEELKSLWGLDLKCSHEMITNNESFTK